MRLANLVETVRLASLVETVRLASLVETARLASLVSPLPSYVLITCSSVEVCLSISAYHCFQASWDKTH